MQVGQAKPVERTGRTTPGGLSVFAMGELLGCLLKGNNSKRGIWIHLELSPIWDLYVLQPAPRTTGRLTSAISSCALIQSLLSWPSKTWFAKMCPRCSLLQRARSSISAAWISLSRVHILLFSGHSVLTTHPRSLAHVWFLELVQRKSDYWPSGSTGRLRPHLLLLGDPGTGKSQLLQAWGWF